MEMWEWQSGERWCGVSSDADRAIEAAEEHLAVGETARVERVLTELSFRTMSSYYVPTGQGWTATRAEDEAGEAVAWQPF